MKNKFTLKKVVLEYYEFINLLQSFIYFRNIHMILKMESPKLNMQTRQHLRMDGISINTKLKMVIFRIEQKSYLKLMNFKLSLLTYGKQLKRTLLEYTTLDNIVLAEEPVGVCPLNNYI